MISYPKKLLIFAAHQDDETIGAGGLIKKWSDYGCVVKVVFITSGDTGIDQENNYDKKNIVFTRMEEVDKVKKILGITEVECLNVPCQTIKIGDQILFHTIIAKIREFRPEVVITHSEIDKHNDHRNASRIVADACWKANENIHSELGKVHRVSDVWAMEITDVFEKIDFVVDISSQFEYKMQAMGIYESQNLVVEGIKEHIEGLSKVRGYQIGQKHGEGFKRISKIPISI